MQRIFRAAFCVLCSFASALPLSAEEPARAAREDSSARPDRRVTFREVGSGVSDGHGIVPRLTARLSAAGNSLVFEVEKGLGGAVAAILLGDGLVTRFTRRPQQLVHPAFAVLWLPLDGAAGEGGAGSGTVTVELPFELTSTTLRAQVRIVDPCNSISAWSGVIEIGIRDGSHVHARDQK